MDDVYWFWKKYDSVGRPFSSWQAQVVSPCHQRGHPIYQQFRDAVAWTIIAKQIWTSHITEHQHTHTHRVFTGWVGYSKWPPILTKESFFHHIIPTLKFIPTKAQNSLKKANDFVHISPLSKRTSKTNAVVKLHLSSFSIVLLPRLCTWSLNTKKPANNKKTAEGKKKIMWKLTHTFFFFWNWHTKQQPNDQQNRSVESSLIWRWYLWLYFQRCRWILGPYNYSRQMTLAPNIQIFPKAKLWNRKLRVNYISM